ncbi:MAG: M15 family metallopeptidase [Nevskiales bacterium]
MRIALLLCLVPALAWACPEDAPEEERPDDIVPLRSIAPSLPQDIRYAGSDNFLGTRVTGYDSPQCLLTRDAAHALMRAQGALLRRGWQLKIYDCYRPQRAVQHFERWAADPEESTRERYYPKLRKPQLLEQVYIAACSGHSRGSTVDVGIIPLDFREPRMTAPDCGAADAQAADMGTGFDCFDPRSHTDTDTIGTDQHLRRLILKQVMETAGFKNYEKEWWHYTLVNEPYPETYFDFPVR